MEVVSLSFYLIAVMNLGVHSGFSDVEFGVVIGFDSNELHLVLLSCGRLGNLGVAEPGTGEEIPTEVSAADRPILVQFYTNVTCQQPVVSV